jgi:hypothetical protein
VKIHSWDLGRHDVRQCPESILQFNGWSRASEVPEPGRRGMFPNDLEIRRTVELCLHESNSQRVPFVYHAGL